MQGGIALLAKLGVKWRLLDTGCCGMAGSFGFDTRHHALSEKIGEDVLFPAVREAGRDVVMLTSGFSYREQIAQGTGRHVSQSLSWLSRAHLWASTCMRTRGHTGYVFSGSLPGPTERTPASL